MKVLVIAENINGNLKNSTFNAIGAARTLSESVDVIVFGKSCEEHSKIISGIEGVDSVCVSKHSALEHNLAEPVAKLLHQYINESDYTHIIASATTFGKNIMPRLAVLLDEDMLSDVIEVVDNNTYKRPIYAGNAIATVKNNAKVQLLTIRPTAFIGAIGSDAQPDKIKELDIDVSNNSSEFVSISAQEQERPDLSGAKVVVSGGRGLQNKENFKIIEKLADKLNAAIGASRAAVDAGYVANDLQVGQTGKVVAPDLYIAVGISGAIQHIAGMKDSKVIVAINKDADAPIFQIADYGLVGDLFDIVPELTEKI